MWKKANAVKKAVHLSHMVSENATHDTSLPTILQGARTIEVSSKIPRSISPSPAPPLVAPPEFPPAKTLQEDCSPHGTSLQRALKAIPKADKNVTKVNKRSGSGTSPKASAWKSAAKMVGHIGIWGKPTNGTAKNPLTKNPCSHEEPRISDIELAELSKLERILVSDYESVEQAFHVVTADKACFTEIDFRHAVSNHRTLADIMGGALGPNDIALSDVPQAFVALCKLLKYETGPIPKTIFLMFPDKLRTERLLRARFARCGKIRLEEAPVKGSLLLKSLSKGAKTPEAAKKLLNQVAAAMQLQPEETAKALLRKTKSSGGTNMGLRHIVKLIRQYGAPISDTGLEVLTSGWAVYGALAKSAIVLGTLQSPSCILRKSGDAMPRHNAMAESVVALGTIASSAVRLKKLRSKIRVQHEEATQNDTEGEDAALPKSKMGVAAKVAHFGIRLMRKLPGARRKKYVRKFTTAEVAQRLANASSELKEEEDQDQLWQMLPPGEVLHCLRGGAKTLDGEDFKQLLHTAWTLFDECHAVSWMIEPKETSDSRAVQLLAAQAALAEIVTDDSRPGQLALDAEPLHQRLVSCYSVLHQLKGICDSADDGLLRRAALYGVPILLERLSMWVHASVEQITNETIANPSRVAAREMDSMINKMQDCFRQYEIAVEDGLGYQMPHHSCDMVATSTVSSTGGAAIVCEEAWARFLQSREKAHARRKEFRELEVGSLDRFCTEKTVTPGFSLRVA